MSEDDRQEGESSESPEPAEELEFAEAAGDDELSAEEQALFASYVFPEPSHRRISAVAFWTFGAALIVAWIALRSDPVVSVGALVGGITLVGAGVWFWSAGWHLRLDQGEALITATREAGFPVGHASALLGWRGVTARPTWRILLYSAETPPSRRGLVEIDATTGEVLGSYTGDNVEDW